MASSPSWEWERILWQRREKPVLVPAVLRHIALTKTACYEELANNLFVSMEHETSPTCH